MARHLSREKQIAVLHHLIQGNTLRSTARLTGVHRTTIMNHMIRVHGVLQLRVADRISR